jgi:hypothetical protein
MSVNPNHVIASNESTSQIHYLETHWIAVCIVETPPQTLSTRKKNAERKVNGC